MDPALEQTQSTQHLAKYAATILGSATHPRITRETTSSTRWQENGFEVRQSIATYEFSDGVIIRRKVEQDDYPPNETLQCAECWITYEVISDGQSTAPVHPRHMAFDSACRESFWLAFHSDPLSPRPTDSRPPPTHSMEH